MTLLKTSAIIPVYATAGTNKPKKRSDPISVSDSLRRLLVALQNQRSPPSEVIVVETDPKPETEQLCRDEGARYLSIHKDSFDHAGTRTYASRLATGEILLFFSQDVFPPDPDCLDRLLEPFESNTKLAAVYGRQLADEGAHPFMRVKREFNYPPGTETRHWKGRDQLGHRTTMFSNAFSAYRRSALAEMGWFGERQLMCEDVAAASTLLHNGHEVHYEGSATVIHAHREPLVIECKRYFDIGASYAELSLNDLRSPATGGAQFLRFGTDFLFKNQLASRVPQFLATSALKWAMFQIGFRHRWLPTSISKRLSHLPDWWGRGRSQSAPVLSEEREV